MRTPRRPRHRVRLAGAALAMATAGVAVTASAASAYVPASDLVSAVRTERTAIFNDPSPLYQNNFRLLDGNPDGISGPDGTPDGLGAFQFYRGDAGGGAIYSHRNRVEGLVVGAVYGAILDSWRASGWENGRYGYPVKREHPVSPNDVKRGCQTGDRAQTFDKDNFVWTACWNPWSGVTWHAGGLSILT
jgi:hypothetical protein